MTLRETIVQINKLHYLHIAYFTETGNHTGSDCLSFKLNGMTVTLQRTETGKTVNLMILTDAPHTRRTDSKTKRVMNNIITLARNASVTYLLLSRILQYLSIHSLKLMVQSQNLLTISINWFAFVRSIVVFTCIFVCCILYYVLCVCLSPNWLYV